jgi:hypothetical protein
VFVAMQNSMKAVAIRAVLKKEGCANIQFELRRNSGFDFSIIENGNATGVFWRAISPQHTMRGDTPATLFEALQVCLFKRYPGYVATDCEEHKTEVAT